MEFSFQLRTANSLLHQNFFFEGLSYVITMMTWQSPCAEHSRVLGPARTPCLFTDISQAGGREGTEHTPHRLTLQPRLPPSEALSLPSYVAVSL